MIVDTSKLVPGRPLGEFLAELPLSLAYRLLPDAVAQLEQIVGVLPPHVWFDEYHHGESSGAIVDVPTLGPVIILLNSWRHQPHDPFEGHGLSVIHPAPPAVLRYRATVCVAKPDDGEAPRSFSDPYWLHRQVA